MDSSSNQRDTVTYRYGPPSHQGKILFTPPGTDRGCETAYWIWGDLTSEIPPLIVVHGGPGAPGRDWKVITPLFARHGIPVLLYDQIGCGESTRLPETKGDTSFWTIDLFIFELDTLRDYLQIGDFYLLGHSWGAAISTYYALTQPPGLRKLILSSTAASSRLRLQTQAKLRAKLPQEMQDVMATCEKQGRFDPPAYQHASLTFSQRHFCRLQPLPPEIQEVMSMLSEDDTIQQTMLGHMTLDSIEPSKDYNVSPRLVEITEKTVPGGVLLTNGRYDMTSDEAMVPFFTRIQARVKWVQFAESAHFAHIEEPQAFLTVLGDFLQTA